MCLRYLGMPLKFVIVAGARPNFMKIAPLLDVLRDDPQIRPILVHTGQHYDDNMSGQFFRELGIPEPDYRLGVGSGTHAQQTADIMRLLEPVLMKERPRAAIVAGDVNSTMAGALAAKKMCIDVVHIEAGLRSFDRAMPEEINRIVTDAISDILLVTEESGRVNLLREGVAEERIHFVGNLMIDSLRRHLPRAMQSEIRGRLGIGGASFGLVTLHRPSNVDDPGQLQGILDAMAVISRDIALYWPVHPRTRARLQDGAVRLPPRLSLLDPLGYLDFLCLEAGSAVVLTDSGGIQEETSVLGIPCLTVRDNTERPVTIEHGTNRLAGTRTETILAAWRETLTSPKSAAQPPLWDGQAGARAVEVLRSYYTLASAAAD